MDEKSGSKLPHSKSFDAPRSGANLRQKIKISGCKLTGKHSQLYAALRQFK